MRVWIWSSRRELDGDAALRRLVLKLEEKVQVSPGTWRKKERKRSVILAEKVFSVLSEFVERSRLVLRKLRSCVL